MSDDRLRDLYAIGQGDRPAGPGGEHPAPEVIAALVRREGPEEGRLATLDHVMSCADCRRDFDLLRAVERAGVESGAGENPASIGTSHRGPSGRVSRSARSTRPTYTGPRAPPPWM